MPSNDDEDIEDAERPNTAEAQRLDKWLWYARLLKSRTLAAHLVQHGKVRVNRVRAAKPSHTVRAGDVLTVALRGNVQVLKVLAPGVRRGPPAEARSLYEVLTTTMGKPATQPGATGQRAPGTGRPSKRERRLIAKFTQP